VSPPDTGGHDPAPVRRTLAARVGLAPDVIQEAGGLGVISQGGSADRTAAFVARVPDDFGGARELPNELAV
jgi:hypothetical protein